MPSLAHFVLTSGISRFSGILPKNERVLPILPKKGPSVLEFQQEGRFNQASRTKRIKTCSCCRCTVDCTVRTTVPSSQKLRAVGRTTVHLHRARSLGHTGARAFRHDRASPIFLASKPVLRGVVTDLSVCFQKNWVRRFFQGFFSILQHQSRLN